MGTVDEKLQYTMNSVDDIQAALIEAKVEGAETDELATYGDKIRTLSNIKVYAKYCDISAGVWDGVTLSDSSYVQLCTNSMKSSWKYYFDEEIDLSKVVSLSAAIIENKNWIRQARASSAYHYTSCINVYGDIIAGVSASNASYGGNLIKSSNDIICTYAIDNAAPTASTNSTAYFRIFLYSNRIEFRFLYSERALFAIKSTKPQFLFRIVCEN